jgi:hypothetical protein
MSSDLYLKFKVCKNILFVYKGEQRYCIIWLEVNGIIQYVWKERDFPHTPKIVCFQLKNKSF